MYDHLTEYIGGRTILDCGSVDHSIENIERNPKTWVHGFLCEHGREVVGVDLVDVTPFVERGFNMIQGDVETIDLGRQFDVVYAGEIIEHLSNPGLFLDNMHRHLADDGTLLITTPNAYGPRRLIRVLARFTNEPGNNPEHTCWHSPSTIVQLLERHRFRIVDVDYFCETKRFNWLLTKLIGRRFGNAMFVIAQKS